MSLWVGFEDEHLAALTRAAEMCDDPVHMIPSDIADAISLIRGRVAHYQSEGARDPRFIAGADELNFVREGECEVDENAVVSASEEGAYVMAWVWVSNSDAGIKDEEEDDDA